MKGQGNKDNIIEFERFMWARTAYGVVDILRLDYPGGYRIAKGIELLKRVVAEDRARQAMIATVACESRDEAAAIEACLAGTA